LRRTAHQTLAKVEDDIGRRRIFNTAVASVMELLNAIGRHAADGAATTPVARAVRQEALEIAVLCLAPIVPHICHQLWQELGQGADLWRTRWRKADQGALVQDSIQLVVQVNGKLRAHINVSPDASNEACTAIALADTDVQRFVSGREPKKVIVVKGKLVNVVV
jgi:leucyl-tRNA synthetase